MEQLPSEAILMSANRIPIGRGVVEWSLRNFKKVLKHQKTVLSILV